MASKKILRTQLTRNKVIEFRKSIIQILECCVFYVIGKHNMEIIDMLGFFLF